MLARLGVLSEDQADAALARLRLRARDDAAADLRARARCSRPCPNAWTPDALRWLDDACTAETVVASTTSTFLVTELAALTAHPERFLNAHWLNPASLIPLVEVSRGPATRDAAADQLLDLLRMAGKTPVMCAPSAGYIVPRIQALAMNEARMVEEGVASAEDIDTAVRLGFGLRFCAGPAGIHRLGRRRHPLLRLALPGQRAGPALRGAGRSRATWNRAATACATARASDYAGVDVDAYRMQRLEQLRDRLALLGLLPRCGSALNGRRRRGAGR